VMTEYVVTRHYRAPEVMTNPTRYDSKIDVWGAGCILAELLGREVLFPGTDYLTQLRLIIETVGSPIGEDLEPLHPNARAYIQDLGGFKKPNWQRRFPRADAQAIDLLDKLLQFNPDKRITVTEALLHPWFQSMFRHDYYRELKVLAIEKKPPGLLDFGWERPRMSKEDLVDLLYEEIARYRPISYDTPASDSTSTSTTSTSTSATSTSTSTTSTLSTSTSASATTSATSATSTTTSTSVASVVGGISSLSISSISGSVSGTAATLAPTARSEGQPTFSLVTAAPA